MLHIVVIVRLSGLQTVAVIGQCTGYTPESFDTQPEECFWTDQFFGFDNLWESLATLTVMISGSAMLEVWNAMTLGRGMDQQPTDWRDTDETSIRTSDLYFHSFTVICFVFVVNVFTSEYNALLLNCFYFL
jgi:hypothetical protein